jgi:predicted nuclease with TOPRIM domain
MSICARTNTDPTWLLTGNGDAPATQKGEPRVVAAIHYINQIDAYNEINKEIKYLRPKVDALRDENSALLRENGELRVEIERLKGRLALLEQKQQSSMSN